MLGSRHPVHPTRQELTLLRDGFRCWRNVVQDFEPFGETHLAVTWLTFLLGRGVARAAQTQFRAQAWDTIIDATRLNLCRSAVRARLKHDIIVLIFLQCKRQNTDSSCATWCIPLVASAHMSNSLAISSLHRSAS